MGQKVHPIGFRLGYTKTHSSKWFSKKDYAKFLHEDLKIRSFIKGKLAHAGVSKVEIERAGENIKINIHTARPGIVIGKKGADVENLKADLQELTDGQVYLNIIEVKNPEQDAQLVAESIAMQLERKMHFRRVMKKAISTAMQGGALGIKVAVSGRLGGAEIARTEWTKDGRIPLHTLKADIDYGFAEAVTTYGRIGVKAWIFKKELPSFKKVKLAEAEAKTEVKAETKTETERKETAENVNAKES
ncbi:MAG: 30S ribosomal protein S3 [bacterium]